MQVVQNPENEACLFASLAVFEGMGQTASVLRALICERIERHYEGYRVEIEARAGGRAVRCAE